MRLFLPTKLIQNLRFFDYLLLDFQLHALLSLLHSNGLDIGVSFYLSMNREVLLWDKSVYLYFFPINLMKRNQLNSIMCQNQF